MTDLAPGRLFEILTSTPGRLFGRGAYSAGALKKSFRKWAIPIHVFFYKKHFYKKHEAVIREKLRNN